MAEDGLPPPTVKQLERKGQIYGVRFNSRSFAETLACEIAFALLGPLALPFVLPIVGWNGAVVSSYVPGRFLSGESNVRKWLRQLGLMLLLLPFYYTYLLHRGDDRMLGRINSPLIDSGIIFGFIFIRSILAATQYAYIPRARLQRLRRKGCTKRSSQGETMITFALNPATYMLYEQLEIAMEPLRGHNMDIFLAAGDPCEIARHTHKQKLFYRRAQKLHQYAYELDLKPSMPRLESAYILNMPDLNAPDAEIEQDVSGFDSNLRKRTAFQRRTSTTSLRYLDLLKKNKSLDENCGGFVELLPYIFPFIHYCFKSITVENELRRVGRLVALHILVEVACVALAVYEVGPNNLNAAHVLLQVSTVFLRVFYLRNALRLVASVRTHYRRIRAALFLYMLPSLSREGQEAALRGERDRQLRRTVVAAFKDIQVELEPFYAPNEHLWGPLFAHMRDYAKVFSLRYDVCCALNITFVGSLALAVGVRMFTNVDTPRWREVVLMASGFGSWLLVMVLSLVEIVRTNKLHSEVHPRMVFWKLAKVEQLVFQFQYGDKKSREGAIEDLKTILARGECTPNNVRTYLRGLQASIRLELAKIAKVPPIALMGIPVTENTFKAATVRLISYSIVLAQVYYRFGCQ